MAAEPELAVLLERLVAHGLAGVLTRYLADASPEALARCLRESAGVDPERVRLHRELLRKSALAPLGPEDVLPVAMTALEEQPARSAEDARAGLAALAAGQVASVALAGGAGTRFFSSLDELAASQPHPNEAQRTGRFDGSEPKGSFPISPVRGLTFYELLVCEALAVAARTGRLPWVLLLTSRLTHERTLAHLGRAELWGFPAGGCLAFRQAEEPRLDPQGDLVVADDRGGLVFTGDGHGGVYRALLAPRPDGPCLLERLRADGVRHLVLHNVDNAAARPFHPDRIGFHVREGADFTLSATRKVDPDEKVGVPMRLKTSGRVEVVEYNVIDPAIASLRDPRTGRLVHEAAHINTNLVALDAVRVELEPTLYTGKRIDSRRGPVESSSLELLNQHLTRLLEPDRVRAYEVSRAEFFMPTKNVTGVDSAVSTQTALSRLAAGRLAAAGAQVAEEAVCDLSPACEAEADAMSRLGIGPGWRLEPGSRLYLCARLGAREGEPVGAPGLALEQGASLLLESALPFGGVALGEKRQVRMEPARASRATLGRDVRVQAGVRVRLRIGPGASLRVRPGRTFAGDTDIEVGPGESLEI
jgi:UDP-N-acetylglucosamine/UDP-N-acetylgalactosamine diphosphorylase